MFKFKLKKFVEKRLKNLPLYSKDKSYTYEVEYYDDIFYVKLYHDGSVSSEEVNKVYEFALGVFLSVNYRLQGITEYKDNHEICLMFLKKD